MTDRTSLLRFLPLPPRHVLLILAAAFLLGLACTSLVVPRFAYRRLDFDLKTDGAIALRWVRAQPAHASNGFYVDADDPRSRVQGRWFSVDHALPSYAVASMRVEPAAPGTQYAIAKSRIITYLTGKRLPTRRIEAGPDGSLGSLPPLWRAVGWRGMLFSGALGSGLAAATLLLIAVGRWLDGLLTRFPPVSRGTRDAPPLPSTSRRHSPWELVMACTALALCIAAPLWMLAWSPVFMVADSTAYLWFAHTAAATHSIVHFDGWRLPGYGLLLAPLITRFEDFAPAVGVVQCVMAIATNLLVFDMLRGRVRLWAACVLTTLVACDPMLLAWQRFMLAETPSTFCIALAAWAFLSLAMPRSSTTCLQKDRRHRSFFRPVCYALILGLACAAACWFRGNNLILPTLLIPGLAMCVWAARHAKAGREAIFAGGLAPLIAGVLVVASLVPLVLINHRTYSRYAFAIGNNFNRAIFSWQNGTTDWNQCGTFSLEEFREFRAMLRRAPMNEWDVMGWVGNTTTIPVPPTAPQWLAMDLRSRAFVDEAFARDSSTFTERQRQAALGLLGVPVTEPMYALAGPPGMFAQLRGRQNPHTTTTYDFRLDIFPPDIVALIQRGIRDATPLQSSASARIYRAWFDPWMRWRWVLGGLFLIGLVRLLCARPYAWGWPGAALGLVALANTIAVPVLTYAAEYRYASPFYPLVAVTIGLGLVKAARGTDDPPAAASCT